MYEISLYSAVPLKLTALQINCISKQFKNKEIKKLKKITMLT